MTDGAEPPLARLCLNGGLVSQCAHEDDFHPRTAPEHWPLGSSCGQSGAIVVTDRGRRVAALQPFDPSVTGRPLPNREVAIGKRSKVPVDSAVYQSELREDR